MSCKIVIPSHLRADRVLSKSLVEDPIICVEEKQVGLYKEMNPDCEIVAHPNDIIGLPAERNWMVSHFGSLFMLDDDVFSCTRMFAEKGEPAKVGSKKEITEIINWLYDLSKSLGISVFGFSNKPRPCFYNEFEPLSLRHIITGCSYGIIKSKNTWWPADKIVCKEDFWISCYVKYTERRVLVDNRYYFGQKDTMTNNGGLASFRNKESEKSSILFIKKCFGDSIISKKNSTLRQKLPFNISAQFVL